MTRTRPEIILQGNNDGQTWEADELKFPLRIADCELKSEPRCDRFLFNPQSAIRNPQFYMFSFPLRRTYISKC